ncbi:MAG: hypothetical protein IKM87_08260 [Clostridia bacterium]|nr:hypothetical protein [Clostridia bacterium]MBR6823130.1 hypothetical protein [Clostridia bacterium]
MENLSEINDEITCSFDKGVIRVDNDKALKELILKGGKKAVLELARSLKDRYENLFGSSIGIKDRSLACEIYYHHRMNERYKMSQEKHGPKRFSAWMLRHMRVIDCGELKKDNNRLIWDFVSLFFR